MSVKRNSFYNLTGALIPLLVSLVTIPIYLKLIGTERYGVLAIAWLLLGYFGLFELGLGRATSFQLASDAKAEDDDTVLNTAMAINLGMGTVGGLIIWLTAEWFFRVHFKVDESIRAEVLQGVPYLALAVPIATLTGVLSGALQGRQRFLESNVISTVSTLFFQLFPLSIAWMYGPNLPRLLLAAISARLLALLVLFLRRPRSQERSNAWTVNWNRGAELLKYGGWVAVTSLIGPLLVITDRFLIGTFLGATAVTHYTLPYQIVQRYAIIPSSLSNALFPKLVESDATKSKELADRTTNALLKLLAAPACVIILMIPPFLNLWLGKEIGEKASLTGQLIFLGFWINAFAIVSLAQLQASGRPDLVAKSLLAQLLPYLALLAFGASQFGLAGCAVVFVIRTTADYVILTSLAQKRFHIPLLLCVLFLLLVGLIIVDHQLLKFSLPWLLAVGVAIGATMILSVVEARKFLPQLRMRRSAV
jgi:O-antigen/teichoic acid export membrane protein